MTPEQQEAYDAYQQFGSKKAAAEHLGIPRSTFRGRLEAAERWRSIDPAAAEAARAGGMSDPA